MIVLLFFIAGILGRMTPTTSALVLTMLQSWISDSVTLSVISSLIIFGAAGGGGLAEKALRYGPLIILGEASYTIYILHFPIWLWWNHYTRIVYKPDWPLAFRLWDVPGDCFSFFNCCAFLGGAASQTGSSRLVRCRRSWPPYPAGIYTKPGRLPDRSRYPAFVVRRQHSEAPRCFARG
jgi:hypothetical protein